MPDFKTRNQIAVAKVETTPGTDASPTVGSDAILVTNFSVSPQLQSQRPNEITGSLDDGAPVPRGGFGQVTCGTLLRSVGNGNEGAAPNFGPLFRGAGFGEDLLAADIADTAQAGTASTLQLAVGDITTDNEHVGRVIQITGGTGYSATDKKQNTRVITASVASTDTVTVFPDWDVTPDATTTYAIRASALYTPISTGLKYLTMKNYSRKSDGGNAVLESVLGSMGNGTINLSANNPAEVSWNFRGALQADTDVSDPGDATVPDVSAFSWTNAQTYFGSAAECVNRFSLDFGNEVSLVECPNEIYGYELADVTQRQMSGSITLARANVSVRDVVQDFLNSVRQKFWTTWGATAVGSPSGTVGSMVSIYVPTVQYTGKDVQDINRFRYDDIPFASIGQNTGVYICIW